MSDKTKEVVVTHILLHIEPEPLDMHEKDDGVGFQTRAVPLTKAIKLSLDNLDEQVALLRAVPVYGGACDGLDIIDVRTGAKLSFVIFSVHTTDWPRLAYRFLFGMGGEFKEFKMK